MGEQIAWVLVAALSAVVLYLLTRSVQPPTPSRRTAATRPDVLLEHEIVERAREGVVILSQSLTPVAANAAARATLGLAEGGLPATLRSDELESLARRAISEQAAVEQELTLWPRRLTVQARAIPLPDPHGVVLFLHDVTQDARLQQIRRQFVVNASHELKTPVTGLLALGEAVRDALPADIDGARKMADQLVREAERLSALTQDLLDMSRVEDPSALRRGRVRLAQVVEQESRDSKGLADEHSIDVRLEIEATGVVDGDEGQLGLMVRNLIDNAIRYSDPGGSVQVRLLEDEGEANLAVVDAGIGIPLRDQARVFERFYRVDEGRSRASGGTGLGLSIVRHVAESHGGHVTLESELGEGSRFTVRLPLAKDSD